MTYAAGGGREAPGWPSRAQRRSDAGRRFGVASIRAVDDRGEEEGEPRGSTLFSWAGRPEERPSARAMNPGTGSLSSGSAELKCGEVQNDQCSQ
jgi:hypothetical protein